MNYKTLPKIDLHCHLDGSVRPETLFELARKQGIDVPELNLLREQLIAPEDCPSLDEYLKRFDLANKVMQDIDSIERITFELFEDAALENVKYLEIRFGPLLHVLKGLSLDEIYQSVIAGMHRACETYEIDGGIIIAALRTMPTDRLDEMIEVGAKYLDQGIVGFDLASSEVAGFAKNFEPFAKKAYALGYKVTIHAGETGVGQNVYDSIMLLKAERIGHGIFIQNHQEAYDAVQSNNIVLEVCPSSNVQTKAVVSMEAHPIHHFIDDGLYVTINTDNRTVSNTTMTREVKRVMETFSYGYDDYKTIYKNSVKRAFTSEKTKIKLLSFLD